jgi:hypothetical protein
MMVASPLVSWPWLMLSLIASPQALLWILVGTWILVPPTTSPMILRRCK